MHRNELEHEYDEGARRSQNTENLRNFMEQAQPGELINSQGVESHMSMSHSQVQDHS